MLKAYKYRIYPKPDQKEKIDRTIGICRLVYNLALEVKNIAFREHGKNMSSIDLCYQLVDLKKDFPWIAEVDSQALQASIKKIDVAFTNYFRQLKDGTIESKKKSYIKQRLSKGLPIDQRKLNNIGKPKFKSKKKGNQSFQCPSNTRRIDWENSTLTIPKIKDIPIVLSRKFEGKIKTVTISRTATGKYFASILVEKEVKLPNKQKVTPENTIGIDVGISSFVVTSDGRLFEPNRQLKNNLNRLKILQRRSSKKKKGSSNRKKSNKCVAILHEKITNSRLDYIHKVTNTLVHDNQVSSIIIEDLNVSGMLSNHKLAQSISDVSWGKFFEILKYKCEWNGKNLIKIDRFDPSSKRCSTCGEINKELKLSDREWTCSNCNTIHDRDLNAAQNIKYYGLKQSGEGISVGPVELRRLRRAKKQEDILV